VLDKVQEQPEGGVVLWLKNVSGKEITALAFSGPLKGPDRYRQFVDYLDAGSTGVPDGATVEWRLNSDDVTTNVGRVFEIDAAIFKDGTADGLQSDVDAMNAKRLGRVVETERLGNLLALAVSGGSDLDALTRGIGALPNSVDAAISSFKGIDISRISLAKLFTDYNRIAFLTGVCNAREEAMWRARETAAPTQTSANPEELTPAARILDLRQAYAEKVKMYRELGQRLLGKLPEPGRAQ
jgi:hypothetical protein